MNLKGTVGPVYLRDLSDECQKDIRLNLSRKVKIAEMNGEDIVVGYYLPLEGCHPVSNED
jgi:hypothetical protein